MQVGDPYEEKRLIEACLELLDAKLVVGIQDLGGAGLVCATSETAARGGVGMDVDVSAVPRREPGMAAYEVMTSESQERMLAIVTPEDLPRVEEVCRRWEVRSAVVGRVTEPPAGRARAPADPRRLRRRGARGRAGRRPSARTPRSTTGRWPSPATTRPAAADDPGALAAPDDCGADVLAMLSDPSWVYRQYDHQLFLNTVEGPGGDAAVLRLAAPGLPPSERGLALTTDSNPTWCAIDPRAGTAATVAEGALNVACAGARPMAVVNCLNFGNPEHPEVMWQLSEAIDGMSEACLALGLPVIGGNVSLYNESVGADIDPTPVIGVLGLIDRLAVRPPGVTLVEGRHAGPARRQRGCLRRTAQPPVAGRVALGRRAAGPPQRDAARPRPARPPTPGRVRHRLVAEGMAGGGVGRRSAEPWCPGSTTCPAAGSVWRWPSWPSGPGSGCRWPASADHHELFTEAPSRVVVCTTRRTELISRAAEAGVGFRVLGADRRRPGGGGGPGRPERGRGHRRLARPAAVAARRAGPGSDLTRCRRDRGRSSCEPVPWPVELPVQAQARPAVGTRAGRAPGPAP